MMNLPPLEIANLVIVAAAIVAGVILIEVKSRRILKDARESARRRLEMRLEGLTGTMADLEARVLELTRSNAELAALINLARAVEKSDGHVLSTGRVAEEVAPETLVMIAAAVTSYLGKPVRIRSAKMLQSPYEIVNPWAQQGRVFVQASHVVRPWNRPGEARGGPMTGVRR